MANLRAAALAHLKVLHATNILALGKGGTGGSSYQGS
jgi:hypothetical protein